MEINQLFFLILSAIILGGIGVCVLSLKLHKIDKKLDRIDTKMGDFNLRITIVETRMEERQKNFISIENKIDPKKKRGRPKKEVPS